MKHLLILMSGFLLMTELSFIPPHQGRSQDSLKMPVHADTIVSNTDKNIDTINAVIPELYKKLTPPKIMYRTKTIVKHVKYVIHDTVFISDTKYISVPDKKLSQTLWKRYTDSLKVLHDSLRALQPKKKSFFKKLF